MVSERMIERLSLYRHLLTAMGPADPGRLYSHELSAMAGATPAQVRRDLMTIGFTGSPAKGYDVAQLIHRIEEWLDMPDGQGAALVGLGNLGRAIIAYFSGRRPKLRISAAFDQDERKVHRFVHGCPCYPVAELATRIRELDLRIGIIAVPAAEAQRVALQLVEAGGCAIVNFAPTPLALPAGIYVDNRDITFSLEKAAYFARKGDLRKVT